MAQPELIVAYGSPYSQRAKWALDSADIQYKLATYPAPPFYLVQLPLRWRIGRLSGKITAPILLPKGNASEVIMDSTAIARWADEHSSSSPGQLFPQAHAENLDRWIRAADSLKSLCRQDFAAAGQSDARFRAALLPPGTTTGVAGVIVDGIVQRVFKTIASKYKETDAAAEKQQVWSELDAARQVLNSNPDKLLIQGAGLTYADIGLACAINTAADLKTKLLPTDPGVRHSSNTPAAAAEEKQQPATVCTPIMQQLLQDFDDLVQWAADTTKRHWEKGPGRKSLF